MKKFIYSSHKMGNSENRENQNSHAQNYSSFVPLDFPCVSQVKVNDSIISNNPEKLRTFTQSPYISYNSQCSIRFQPPNSIILPGSHDTCTSWTASGSRALATAMACARSARLLRRAFQSLWVTQRSRILSLAPNLDTHHDYRVVERES